MKQQKLQSNLTDESMRKDHRPFRGSSSGPFQEKALSSSVQPPIISTKYL